MNLYIHLFGSWAAVAVSGGSHRKRTTKVLMDLISFGYTRAPVFDKTAWLLNYIEKEKDGIKRPPFIAGMLRCKITGTGKFN